VNRLMNLLICITKENYNTPKNRIVKNRCGYCVSAKETRELVASDRPEGLVSREVMLVKSAGECLSTMVICLT